MEPSQDPDFLGRDGTISAIGLPNFVIRTGAPVFLTSSRTAKHVALNLETAISLIYPICTMVKDHGKKIERRVRRTAILQDSMAEAGMLS